MTEAQAFAQVRELDIDEVRQGPPAHDRCATPRRIADGLRLRELAELRLPAEDVVDCPQLAPTDAKTTITLETFAQQAKCDPRRAAEQPLVIDALDSRIQRVDRARPSGHPCR